MKGMINLLIKLFKLINKYLKLIKFSLYYFFLITMSFNNHV